MPRYRSHSSEDKGALKERLISLRGSSGTEFHDLVGNALVEFLGFRQEEDKDKKKVERLLFYDFKLRIKSPITDPRYIGDNGFVQRRINYTHPVLKAKARVSAFYIGKMSFRNGRGVFGLINLSYEYRREETILRVEGVLETIRDRPEMRTGTIEERFRFAGQMLEKTIAERVVGVGYSEEEDGKKVVRYTSFYVGPGFVATLL